MPQTHPIAITTVNGIIRANPPTFGGEPDLPPLPPEPLAPPIQEPEPDRLPDEEPVPNDDENDKPLKQ